MLFRIPSARVNWRNSIFLIGTALATVTAVPWYLWTRGWDGFQAGLFFSFFVATGLSITLGYHRLFAHLSFQARWPVRLVALVFGAAAFENCALAWASDHRRHHRHVDHEGDPYDISKGFWHAHMGWILFKVEPEPPYDNVPDLERDPLVRWQQRYYLWIAALAGFVLPAAVGALYGGWDGALGGFLLAGVARVTLVQQMTFFINSLCHTIGSRPYSTRCTARDSWLMALFTFGEGYHNYHHEFQHDYRNGVKWWQWDPTKWTIWTLGRLGLVRSLRRVPEERVLLAQLLEARRRIDQRLACPVRPLDAALRERMSRVGLRLAELSARAAELERSWAECRASGLRQARESIEEVRLELRQALRLLDAAPA